METSDKEVVWNEITHVEEPLFSSYHDGGSFYMRCQWGGYVFVCEFTAEQCLRIIDEMRKRTKVTEIPEVWKEMNGD